ncbi:hypothetical protein N7478_010336 [Penicillium angulare]|uniref:uncharacterized protein n=1 Tax=Penicillium angulare TaxID=116970 RepID=UPI002541FB7E|nr:uncharacterized protein N7478_010336 [Penicillium angulare]KAJ5267528.1 hypothetical protein N7478_010336 [Penicillium angulare]
MRSQSHQSGNYPRRSLSQTSATTSSSRSTQRSDEKKHHRLSNPLTSKLFRPDSKSPAAINIPKNRQSADAHYIPRSNPDAAYFGQEHSSTSPVKMSPEPSSPTSPTSPQSPKPDFGKRPPTPTRKNSDDYRRYSGTVNHYGRHSNDWLFGGFSVRDTVRDGIDKLRHHDKDD